MLTEEEIDQLLAGLKKSLLKAKSVDVNMQRPVKHVYDPFDAKTFGQPVGFRRSGPEVYSFSIEYPGHYDEVL
jgi:hypothetical protein